MAERIRDRLAARRDAVAGGVEELRTIVAEEIAAVLRPVAEPLDIDAFPRPQVILVIGVNGSGKTTTIAKLAHLFQEQDYGVMLVAGDTFRAAAIGQLKVWAERLGVPIMAGPEGGDSAGIVFDAVKQATATGIDVLIVDTAGRLQNKRELMDELAKIKRVLGRLNPAAPHDVVLVLDATTGQNALVADRRLPRGCGRHRAGDDQARRHCARRRARRRRRTPRPPHSRDRHRRDDRGPSSVRRRRDRGHHCRKYPMSDVLPTGPETVPTPPAAKHGWLNFVIDFGPLLVFFLAYKFSSGGEGAFAATTAAIKGTVAFMVAIIIAMIVSKWKLGKISPMLWMSSILVLGFGALTIWFHDERFIVMKPTIIYTAFAVLLLGGVLVQKADAQISAAVGARRPHRPRLAAAVAQLGDFLCDPRHRQSCDVRD
jgi:KaiC/GvpD/RAD55 family RecA-like ATPase